MTVNPSGWRPSTPANEQGEQQTVTGNRALMLEEPLIFEMDGDDSTGVDFASMPKTAGNRRSPSRRWSARYGSAPAFSSVSTTSSTPW